MSLEEDHEVVVRVEEVTETLVEFLKLHHFEVIQGGHGCGHLRLSPAELLRVRHCSTLTTRPVRPVLSHVSRQNVSVLSSADLETIQ